MHSTRHRLPTIHLPFLLRPLAALALALLLVGPGLLSASPAAAEPHKLKVVASFSILGDWIQNVAGPLVDVKVLDPAGGDAHTFDPAPNQVADIADASVIFQIGAGFEPWLDDVYDASGSNAPRIVVSNGVKLRTLAGADSETSGGESGSDKGTIDPHIWGNVQNAVIAVNNIVTALSQADPDNKAVYRLNADKYIAQLNDLDTSIKTEVATLPADQRKLVTSHDALGYYCDAYGFTIVGTALGVTTEEAEPSAKQIAALVDQIKASGVKAVFAENIENPALMDAIAKEAGVKVGPVLYTDALGEPGTDGDTYIKMETYNTNSIVNALLGQ